MVIKVLIAKYLFFFCLFPCYCNILYLCLSLLFLPLSPLSVSLLYFSLSVSAPSLSLVPYENLDKDRFTRNIHE